MEITKLPNGSADVNCKEPTLPESMTDHVQVKVEQVQSSENETMIPSDAGRLRIQNSPVRVKLRNVRLRKPNWTPKESLDLLDEFEKHKLILNSRGNTGLSTKAKRKIAWTRIANRINSKGYSAVKRTVYECKRRWKNMVTFAKLSILEYVKAIKLGGDPTKTVTDMERRITDVHGDTKLLHTLELAENKDLDALSDLVEVETVPTDRPSSTTHVEGNIGFSPTSILGNYGLQLTSQQTLNRRQTSRSPRKSFYDNMVAIDDDDRSQGEISMQTIEEHTPSIENYYSIHPEDFTHNTNEVSESQLGGDQTNVVDESRFSRDGIIDHSSDPQEASIRRKKLKLEVEKLQLEKEVLEMQKVKLRLETKAWRRFVAQRSTPPPPQQTPAPFTMAPFYWPSPTPGFPPFYGAAPTMGNVGMSQIPVHATTTNIKND